MTDVQAADRLLPDLRPLAALLRIDLSPEKLAPTRRSLDARRAEVAAAHDLGEAAIDDLEVKAPDGRAIRCRLYRRPSEATPPVLLYFHSGAFVLGNLDTDHRQCVSLCADTGWAVLSVDYRLAPEHPYPAALDDARTVFDTLPSLADTWGFNAETVAVAGNSAGGCLAALLAGHALDSGRPLRAQLLHQPVLDDQCATPSMTEFTATPGFDSAAAHRMWQYYRGAHIPDQYLSAARRPLLTDLPPTLITCSEIDPLRDEALAYAQRLLIAGIPTDLHVFSATCHGFDSIVFDSPRAVTFRTLQSDFLLRVG
jgi:acetyl esterase